MTTQQWPDPTMINGLTESETSATASVAGLSTKEAGLPVVAWRSRYISEPGMIGHYPWHYLDRACTNVTMAPGYEYRPLADHADAQAIIDALRADNERLTRELEDSYVLLHRTENEKSSLKIEINHWLGKATDFQLALKAAQPDPEKVLALADSYGDWCAEWVKGPTPGIDTAKRMAREALSAYVTAKEVK